MKQEIPTVNINDLTSEDTSTVPTVNINNLVPNTATTSSAQTRTNPAFLGSNPIDILKNLTIGNRTQ
jgi:hypothetical protein